MFLKSMKRVLPILLTVVVITVVFNVSSFRLVSADESEAADEETVIDQPLTGDSLEDGKEFRAVWIAYYDFSDSQGSSKAEFTSYIETMFDNAKSWGMNAVVVHVRPFSDAMYKSEYFPWSSYASGQQGINPGYDPLKIMVDEAHERGIRGVRL